jgi:alanyl-tRNA synthetase
LCGGTHLSNTAEVGLFLITAEGSAASGIRRIEAVTGWSAYERARAHDRVIAELSALTRAAPAELVERVTRLSDQAKNAQRPPAGRDGADLTVRSSTQVDGVAVITARIEGAGHEALRAAGDRLRERMGAGVYILAGASGDRVNMVTMVTPDVQERGIRADDLMRTLAGELGGTGGGRPEMAQGAGRDPDRLDAVLEGAAEHVRRLAAR